MFARKKQPVMDSVVAHGTRIEGNVFFVSGICIQGEVQGDITASATESSLLVISETSKVNGTVRAAHVIVNGHVTGTVHATELLELQSKARITGNVHYKALEMHQGAVIAGEMCPAAEPVEEKPPLQLPTSSL
jgi:cytoskeletal protein CcmA (bactofilin family)